MIQTEETKRNHRSNSDGSTKRYANNTSGTLSIGKSDTQRNTPISFAYDAIHEVSTTTGVSGSLSMMNGLCTEAPLAVHFIL